MNNAVIYVAIALLIWFVYKQFAPIKGVKNLSWTDFENELKQSGDHAQLIDVREQHEFMQGKIGGAKNIPLSQISQKLDQLSSNKPIYLYCRSGMRSKQAGKILSRNGYKQIYNLNGGIMAWRGPIVK